MLISLIFLFFDQKIHAAKKKKKKKNKSLKKKIKEKKKKKKKKNMSLRKIVRPAVLKQCERPGLGCS